MYVCVCVCVCDGFWTRDGTCFRANDHLIAFSYYERNPKLLFDSDFILTKTTLTAVILVAMVIMVVVVAVVMVLAVVVVKL